MNIISEEAYHMHVIAVREAEKILDTVCDLIAKPKEIITKKDLLKARVDGLITKDEYNMIRDFCPHLLKEG